MTKNKDPMLQELGTVINNRTATQKAQVPFNEQAAFLIKDALDLIKQVLIKHSAAVLEEMRDQIAVRNARIAVLEKNEKTLMNLLSACRCHIDNASFDEEGDLTESVDNVLGLKP